MCTSSAPKVPKVAVPEPPQPAEPPAPVPQANDPAIQSARDNTRQRRMAAAGANNTLVTGGAGITAPASTGLKSAFGQ